MSEIQVQIFETFVEDVSAEWLRDLAFATLSVEGRDDSKDLSIAIADDESVAELNGLHRGLDGATDVLSFSNEHSGHYYGDDDRDAPVMDETAFVLPPDIEPGLGEVIISYPQAVRQAAEAGHSVRKELATLLAHGIFHLLGYDHEEDAEAVAMRSKEGKAMASFVAKGLIVPSDSAVSRNPSGRQDRTPHFG